MDPMSEESLKIMIQLKAILQKDVTDHFGRGRPTLKGVEDVRQYAQDRLDQYIRELQKQSKELQEVWKMGHPFVITSRISLDTHTYAIDITAKDGPKAPPR